MNNKANCEHNLVYISYVEGLMQDCGNFIANL